MKDVFDKWFYEFIEIIFDNLKIDIFEIKVNEVEVKKYFLDGFIFY